MAGIYIHIPFCRQACHYCDFHFSTNTDIRADLVRAITDELRLQQNYLGTERVSTIYFGGGTPSLLDEAELNAMLSTLYNSFGVAPDAEITLEANPDDLDQQKLSAMMRAGVNRLSIGIQSFDDAILQYLNRAHNSHAAIQSVMWAKQAGFNNISIDLIYAIPGQSEEAWKRNIVQAIDLEPQHISSYSLTIEPQTAFGNRYKRGKLVPVPDERAAAQLEILVDMLAEAGYDQYEVSNFSKPGFESRHNSSYWQQTHYLGVGPSAHSYNGVSRQYNISNNHLYVKSLNEGKIPFEREVLSHEDHVNEYLLTTLRTRWGCSLHTLKEHYGYNLLESRHQYLKTLFDNSLAIIENNHLKLTKAGRLLADKISSDLFLTPS